MRWDLESVFWLFTRLLNPPHSKNVQQFPREDETIATIATCPVVLDTVGVPTQGTT